MIWFACIWSIWKARNRKLFQNKEIDVDRMVEVVNEYIKMLTLHIYER